LDLRVGKHIVCRRREFWNAGLHGLRFGHRRNAHSQEGDQYETHNTVFSDERFLSGSID
jgi:hypothetical protein